MNNIVCYQYNERMFSKEVSYPYFCEPTLRTNGDDIKIIDASNEPFVAGISICVAAWKIKQLHPQNQ